jgi:hypothetical protein
MYLDKNTLFKDLGNKLGLAIDIETGAVGIKGKNGSICYIECPHGSDQVLFHSAIAEKTLEQASPLELKLWLTINGQSYGGGWIGYHVDTKTVRFFCMVPLEKADASLLSNILNFVADSTRTIKQVVAETLAKDSTKTNIKPLANYALPKSISSALSANAK